MTAKICLSKFCFKCGLEKSLTEYYKHKHMGDGLLNKCKDCTKSDTKKRTRNLACNPSWVKAEQDRHREKYHRLGYKDIHKQTPEKRYEQTVAFRAKHPEKHKAHCLSAKLESKEGHHLHHWSYNEIHYKDIIELPLKDHYTAHRYIVYDKKTKMYKDLEGNLLDTKENHFDYISKAINNTL